MIFKEKYEDLLKTQDWFKREYDGNYCIENNIIQDIDIVVTGHFANSVSLTMTCDCISPIPLYNSTSNIGFIIQALIEIFDREDDSSVSIKALKNTPIRIVFDDTSSWGGKAIAIGHFMKDRFVLIEDLMKVGLKE